MERFRNLLEVQILERNVVRPRLLKSNIAALSNRKSRIMNCKKGGIGETDESGLRYVGSFRVDSRQVLARYHRRNGRNGQEIRNRWTLYLKIFYKQTLPGHGHRLDHFHNLGYFRALCTCKSQGWEGSQVAENRFCNL